MGKVEKPIKEGKIPVAFALGIHKRTAGKDGEPAPKRLLGIKLSRVADEAEHRGLQGVARGVLAAARDDQEVTEEAVEIEIIKLAVSSLVLPGKAGGEPGDVRLGDFARLPETWFEHTRREAWEEQTQARGRFVMVWQRLHFWPGREVSGADSPSVAPAPNQSA